jgi:hypothetical protein
VPNPDLPHSASAVIAEHLEPERGDAPDLSNDGLIRAGQWVALAAAALLVLAGLLLTSAIVQSHTWPAVHVEPGGTYSWVSGHGAGVVIIGGVAAIGFAVAVFTMARSMAARPRGVARAYVALAAIFAALALLVIVRPTAVLGTVPIAGGIRGMSDVRVAGLGFLIAAGLLAVAAGLAFTTLARLRKEQERREAEKYRPKG